MDNRQNEIKVYFDGLYKKGITPWTSHPPGKALSEFLKLLKNEIPEARILDIGCGNGWISIKAAKESFEVWGIDGSETAILKAVETAARENVEDKTHFEVGDVLSLPYKKDFFNGLIDRGLFHHILPGNRELYLENILRMLKKNSFMYLAVFSMNNPEGIGQRFTENKIVDIFRPYFEIVDYKVDPISSNAPANLMHYILKIIK
jgi:cyclopropane fatty-acyl-phospholipid synthase-like methyltransferase